MPERASTTIRADALPAELAALLPRRLLAATQVRVTLEVQEPTHEEWLEAVRVGIDRGRREIASGLAIDGETAMSDMRRELFGERSD